jgi:hypothetical protein
MNSGVASYPIDLYHKSITVLFYGKFIPFHFLYHVGEAQGVMRARLFGVQG